MIPLKLRCDEVSMLSNARSQPATVVKHRSRVINAGTSRQSLEPMAHLLRNGTESRRKVEQLGPIREQLSRKANRFQILVELRAHAD